MSTLLAKIWQPALRTGTLARHSIALHGRAVAGIAAGAVVVGAAAWIISSRNRPSSEELERRRRERLTSLGRLTDGSILDARTLDGHESYNAAAEILLYRYRISGVTYDCAQDVTTLAGNTTGYRIDQPVQVRYDPHNPGNSIIVSEQWSGLRSEPVLLPNTLSKPV